MISEIYQIKEWIKQRFGRLENIPNGDYAIKINGRDYRVGIKNDYISGIHAVSEAEAERLRVEDYANSGGWEAYGL
jgi:hypothetical protein